MASPITSPSLTPGYNRIGKSPYKPNLVKISVKYGSFFTQYYTSSVLSKEAHVIHLFKNNKEFYKCEGIVFPERVEKEMEVQESVAVQTDNLNELREAQHIYCELNKDVEVMRTTFSEIYRKLANMKRNDPLVKYMKKVVNMFKKELRAINGHLGHPETLILARKIDAVMLQYEQLRHYFKSPCADNLSRVIVVANGLEHYFE